MAFGTVDGEKGDLAASVAGAVGLLTDAPGNRLGIATLDRRRARAGSVPGPAGSLPTQVSGRCPADERDGHGVDRSGRGPDRPRRAAPAPGAADRDLGPPRPDGGTSAAVRLGAAAAPARRPSRRDRGGGARPAGAGAAGRRRRSCWSIPSRADSARCSPVTARIRDRVRRRRRRPPPADRRGGPRRRRRPPAAAYRPGLDAGPGPLRPRGADSRPPGRPEENPMTFLSPLWLLILVPVAAARRWPTSSCSDAASATPSGSPACRCSTRWCPGARAGAGTCPPPSCWSRSPASAWPRPAPSCRCGCPTTGPP